MRLTVGLIGLVGLAGCSTNVEPSHQGSAQDGPPAMTASVAASPTSPAPSAVPSWTGEPAPPEALGAYDAMMRDVTAVAATSDYKNPRLAAHMTAQALSFWTTTLANQQAKGLVSRGAPQWSPRVTKVIPDEHPDRVEVADCLDDSAWLKYKPDGTAADDVAGGKHVSAAAIVRKADGSWVVDQQVIGAIGTC